MQNRQTGILITTALGLTAAALYYNEFYVPPSSAEVSSAPISHDHLYSPPIHFIPPTHDDQTSSQQRMDKKLRDAFGNNERSFRIAKSALLHIESGIRETKRVRDAKFTTKLGLLGYMEIDCDGRIIRRGTHLIDGQTTSVLVDKISARAHFSFIEDTSVSDTNLIRLFYPPYVGSLKAMLPGSLLSDEALAYWHGICPGNFADRPR